MPDGKLPIQVVNPTRLPGWQMAAQRIPVGITGDYKPSIALLPDGGLVMVALFQEGLPGDKVRESTPIWRSSDGGKTWSEREIIQDMIGREQWLTCTSDGSLFATGHILDCDVNNTLGVIHSYVHRSVDGGRTWERTRVAIDEGELRGIDLHYGCSPSEAVTLTSRNIVETSDGTLLLGVCVCASSHACLWKSNDHGKTWIKTPGVKIAGYYDNYDGFFAEGFTYQTVAGKLIHFFRVGHPSPMAAIVDERVSPVGNDQCDRTMRCESTDSGCTWTKLRDMGDYGMMYPRLLRLRDGRLLLTFTQRALIPPLGMQAILSYDDGETWDFGSDRIIIEGKTPWGMPSGGGFGNTVQIEDGTLVSCYSFRGADDSTHVEVVRWSLA